MVGTLVMAPKSVTFRRHDHLVSVLFGDLLSHSYNITFSMFLYLVIQTFTQYYNTLHVFRSYLRSYYPGSNDTWHVLALKVRVQILDLLHDIEDHRFKGLMCLALAAPAMHTLCVM